MCLCVCKCVSISERSPEVSERIRKRERSEMRFSSLSSLARWPESWSSFEFCREKKKKKKKKKSRTLICHWLSLFLRSSFSDSTSPRPTSFTMLRLSARSAAVPSRMPPSAAASSSARARAVTTSAKKSSQQRRRQSTSISGAASAASSSASSSPSLLRSRRLVPAKCQPVSPDSTRTIGALNWMAQRA